MTSSLLIEVIRKGRKLHLTLQHVEPAKGDIFSRHCKVIWFPIYASSISPALFLFSPLLYYTLSLEPLTLGFQARLQFCHRYIFHILSQTTA